MEENPSRTLLQYVDGLLLASHDREKCWDGTLLTPLSEVGYKVFGKRPKCASKRSHTLIHHFRRTTSSQSGEEMGHLLHPIAKDQKGGLRILGSGRILSRLDTWIFKPGQTTL
jgi:hypothetical protein